MNRMIKMNGSTDSQPTIHSSKFARMLPSGPYTARYLFRLTGMGEEAARKGQLPVLPRYRLPHGGTDPHPRRR